MLKCLTYSEFDVELRIFIPNSFETWDPYVHAKYRTLSERYQGAEKEIFQISNLTSTTGKIPVVFHRTYITQAHKCIVNNGTDVVWIFRQSLIFGHI